MLDGDVAGRWQDLRLDETTSLGSAMLRGSAVLLENIREVGTRYPALEADTVRAGFQATASLPLRGAGGDVIGAVGLAWREPQSFDDARMGRLSLIAEVTGQALDRALLDERERAQRSAVEVAQTNLLQNAFLPSGLPEVPGLDVAVAYLLASGSPLGGDWYDVFPVDKRMCLVIGDVPGTGWRSRWSWRTSAIRAYACMDPLPSSTLTRANRLLCRLEPNATATVILAPWDPTTMTLLRANAGHRPPLRCRGGTPEFLTPPRRHRLLGAVDGEEYSDDQGTLRVGTTIPFYTDGLIEDRNGSLDEGMAALRAFKETLDDRSPGVLYEAVVQWRSARARRDDDMCIMAVRVAERRVRNVGRIPDRRRSTSARQST